MFGDVIFTDVTPNPAVAEYVTDKMVVVVVQPVIVIVSVRDVVDVDASV
jgi:hypothetical protein